MNSLQQTTALNTGHAQTQLMGAEGYMLNKDEDPGFEGAPDKSWKERLRFGVKESDGLYVLYDRDWEPVTPLPQYQTVKNYNLLVWYENKSDYEASDFGKAVKITQFRLPYDREFSLTAGKNFGNLSDGAWDRVWKAVDKNNNTIDYATMYEWGKPVPVWAISNKLTPEELEKLKAERAVSSPVSEVSEDVLKEEEGSELPTEIEEEIVNAEDELLEQSTEDDAPDEVSVVEPGTEIPRRKEDVVEDHDSIPVDIVHRKPAEDNIQNDFTENESASLADKLNEIAEKVIVSNNGMTLSVKLLNKLDFTITKVGGKYSLSLDSYLYDSEIDSLLESLGFSGGTGGRKGRFQLDAGKLDIPTTMIFGYNKAEGMWELEPIKKRLRELTMLSIVDFFGKIPVEESEEEADEAEEEGIPLSEAEKKMKDINLLEGMEDVINKLELSTPPKSGVEEEDTEKVVDLGETTDTTTTTDEWHEFLVNLGFDMIFKNKYIRKGKGAIKNIIAYIVRPSDDPAVKGKAVQFIVNKNKTPPIWNIPEARRSLISLAPEIAEIATQTALPDLVNTEETRQYVVRTMFLIDHDGVDYLLVEGEESATHAWLTSHGFMWKPAMWVSPFMYKAKALKWIEKLKILGIEITNYHDVIQRIMGKKGMRRLRPSQIEKEMLKELRRKPDDMRFSIHYTKFGGQDFIIAYHRRNNQKAAKIFRKLKFQLDTSGFWLPVASKQFVDATLVALKEMGLKVADWDYFASTYEDVYGRPPTTSLSTET